MSRAIRRSRGWVLVLVLVAVAAACGDSGSGKVKAAPASPKKFACFDFLAAVTSGPDAGRSWTGDLVLTADETGAFTGRLVRVGDVDRQTLEVRSGAGSVCRAVGQRNGAQVSWFLYCENDERIFGTGQIRPVGDSQELRGIIQGPADSDFGVYHGRNYPPYIRIISPSFN